MSEAQIEQLLDRLDRQEAERGAHQERRLPRKSYRTRHAVISVVRHGGQEVASYRVPTRNLSAGGIGFLHKWMLTPGTNLRILLPTPAGKLKLEAVVVHCRHIKGMIHEVGARFTSPADVEGALG